MHICIFLYIHVTVLYYILASFQKIKMLMLMLSLLLKGAEGPKSSFVFQIKLI